MFFSADLSYLFGETMTLESKFQFDLIKEINASLPGCVVMKMDANYRQGFPDLLILFGHAWAALEVKASGRAKKQPNQDYWIDRLDALSFAAFICPENKEAILRELFGFLKEQARVFDAARDEALHEILNVRV
jgi:hypothetical protein